MLVNVNNLIFYKQNLIISITKSSNSNLQKNIEFIIEKHPLFRLQQDS